MTHKLALVTACDERFYPVAKGLLLSLRRAGLPNDECHVYLLDLGCSVESQLQLIDQGIRVVPLAEVRRHIPFSIDRFPVQTAAMAGRPFLREIIPNYDIYTWIDADAWVQNGASLRLYWECASSLPDRVIACAQIDVSYWLHYDLNRYREYATRAFSGVYEDAGEQLSNRAVITAGVFSLSRNAPVWAQWGEELAKVYGKNYTAEKMHSLHLAEQTALNWLICTGKVKVCALEPIYNYEVCCGEPLLDSQGIVRLRHPPHREVSLVRARASGNLGIIR